MTARMSPEEVPGLIPVATGRELERLAALVPHGQCVVEIGAFQGRSTCFLASGSAAGARVPVYSIDPWTTPGNPPGRGGRFVDPANYVAYQRHLRACGVFDLVTTRRAFSWDAPLPREPVGLLWIDGAHDQKSVERDVARFGPLLPSGAVVVFDDYGTFHPGVNKTVATLRRSAAWHSWRFDLVPLAIGVRT